jgi:hypothetical protein
VLPLSAIPFSRDEFLEVFAAYNRDIAPGQGVLYLVGLACLILVFCDRGWARRTIMILLGGLWLWMAVAYHLLYFTRVNLAAWAFAALFITQTALLFRAALDDRAQLSEQPLSRSFGAILVLYAMVVYPILGQLSDHAYPRAPTFGLPCPTTIFTFGVLLLTSQRVAWWLFVIPSAWAVVGATAPFQFGIWEDLGLLIAAVISVAVAVRRTAIDN